MEKEIKEYLGMQHAQYERRAATAIVKKNKIDQDGVVGSYDLQEQFPYDDNILKYFKGPFDSVFEYGCGPGRNLRRLAKKFKCVAGTDISEQNILNAKRFLALNGVLVAELMVTSGDNIPTTNQYNLVFEVICLQHICSYTIRRRILSDMVRVCKSGGTIVLQMGFNDKTPPRSNQNTRYYVGYYDEQLVDVQDTNGASDCCVTDNNQIVKDLSELGIKDVVVWHTQKVVDTNHDSWIWASGVKP